CHGVKCRHHGTFPLTIRSANQAGNTVKSTVPPAPSGVYYKNCDAARAAGAAPIYAGEPGYRLDLDRNKDGVACE
ncbi:excalibur calcium-binding domain-containing protein, partial [Nocardia sp. NPDC001965]